MISKVGAPRKSWIVWHVHQKHINAWLKNNTSNCIFCIFLVQILLKMGGYGLDRINIELSPDVHSILSMVDSNRYNTNNLCNFDRFLKFRLSYKSNLTIVLKILVKWYFLKLIIQNKSELFLEIKFCFKI